MTTTKPLAIFATAGQFHRQLAIEDDSRLYPFADAIRSLNDPRQVVKAGAMVKWEMTRYGLIDGRTGTLTEVGRSIWNHLKS